MAQVFFTSLIMMVIFGLIGAAAKLSKNRFANSLANGYTVFFRGTPEILVLLLIYFGSAIALTAVAQVFDPSVKFVDIPPFWAGSFAIALIVGAYATETFRGAFMGVDPGHVEAARALGLSNLQTFVYVRIPEMWRIALPAFGNHMLSLIKDTALISIDVTPQADAPRPADDSFRTDEETAFSGDLFADNGAGVDPDNCAATGSGHQSLCTVWRDPDYSASQAAFYYVRVLENPSCRWSTLQCQAAGVNPFADNCAEQAEQQIHPEDSTNCYPSRINHENTKMKKHEIFIVLS